MSTREVAAAFDEISAVYDSTREPLDDATLDGIASQLHARGIRTVLEVGVGTGRIASPLQDRGFEVTGLDLSRRMLSVARSKGLTRLIHGSAYRLPFRDRSFDTTLFAHVLHILDDVPTALDEGIRVARLGVTGLVHPQGAARPGQASDEDAHPRRIFYRYLVQEGYPLPDRSGSPRARERALLAQVPPDDLVVISDREVTEPLARRIDMLERRGSRHILHVPPEILHKAAAAARAEIGDRTITYRRVEALATWSKGPYRPLPTG